MDLYSYLSECLDLFMGALSLCWSVPVLRFFMAAMLLAGAVGLVLLLHKSVQR